jgi:murein DD-endopeptidase MepM/ murein hydrolase activator NlpD
MTHRRAGMPINGAYVVAQRFAIDWIKLGDDGAIVHGNWLVNTDYPTYEQRAIAVADATVVSVLDGLPERKAGALPPDTTLQNATGNHVILDLGEGRYAFYAHLQPGSIRVKVGNRVKRGQVLAQLGNSGNTTGPHLHFHVMDGISPLSSQGVPYVLTGFKLVGQADEIADGGEEKSFAAPMKIHPLPPPAARRLEYPMNYVVVDFPEGK